MVYIHNTINMLKVNSGIFYNFFHISDISEDKFNHQNILSFGSFLWTGHPLLSELARNSADL
ncbi:MAG: hypothetical protein CBD27_06215 [Rhodospirillaceae bacterium TMED167]|nr:hypothetical protein [Rhodospirillaceae bacterium]OUW27428.1 MAG: hypothetical protein CBD27_06215 [Rhodospirillaceae bacterium TMED167]